MISWLTFMQIVDNFALEQYSKLCSLVTFASDRLVVVCVRGLCSAFAKFLRLLRRFNLGFCVNNYSGEQRGQSVSTFYLS